MPLSAEEKRIRKLEAQKKWREKNKEKIAEYKKEYDKENKDKIAEYQKSPQRIKSTIISGWKKSGLVHEDYDALYKTYIETNECNVCKKVFETSFERCMDHDHTTGLFRQILCRNCNNMDNWKKKI